MKNVIILISLLLLFGNKFLYSCNDSIGIGLVKIHYNYSTILYFYDHPSNNKIVSELIFYDDIKTKTIKIKELEYNKQWLKPEVLWLDYYRFIFRCKSQVDGWFEIVVNQENYKTLWLKKDTTTEFMSWFTYLEKMFSIARINPKDNFLYFSPDTIAIKIDYKGIDCFKIKSMKDNWIEIYSPEYCVNMVGENSHKIESGWIRWKNKCRLLIYYQSTP